MKKELFLAAALAGCTQENQLEGVTPVDCYDRVTDSVVDRNITAKPTDRPHYDVEDARFDELWELKGDTANRVETLVALASLPQLDGDYTEYDRDDVVELANTDSVPLGGDDIDYPVGLMTQIDFGDEAALDGTWVDIAIVNQTYDTLHGWGEFSIDCQDGNPDCRPNYTVTRDAFLDFDGQMKY